jgi:2-oxoisovalerate dehydrogenase E2 component (dihydrolipoyl transacylase)
MAFTLTMPGVGETVTEGTIERWLKQPGDKVQKYEPIVEVNTDKVNVELPCPVSGTVLEILAPEGETVNIGAPLCTIAEAPGEKPADIAPTQPREEPAEPPPTAAAPREEEREALSVGAPGRGGNGAAGTERRPGERQRATPRVRKLAQELGVDLARIDGSGPGGRIVEADVRAASRTRERAPGAERPREPERAPAPARPAVDGAGEERAPLTAIRRTIAQRMTEAAKTPHAWMAVEADVTDMVRLRQARREAFRERYGVDLTYLPFIAHAVCQTLIDHPYLNASWGEDHIVLKKRIHLGIAVATGRGLLVPVVRDADRLSISGLAQAMTGLGERARDNKLQLEDVQGGTFTLDNTGAFGSVVSVPIINVGQSAILTTEAITKQPRVVGDDAIAVRSVMMLCLSFDHRTLDGHQAGYFLRDLKRRLESFGPDSGMDL